MVGEWKRQAMEGLTAVLSGTSAAQESAKTTDTDVEKLHAEINRRLWIEIDLRRISADGNGNLLVLSS